MFLSIQSEAFRQEQSANHDRISQEQIAEQQRQIELLKAEAQMYKDRLSVTYQVEANNADLRVAGVAVIKGKCKAFNSYGDLLNLSQIECKSYISEAGKILRNRQYQ